MKNITAFILLLATIVCAETISREEALKAVYPGAQIRPDVVFLTDHEKREAAKAAGVDISTALVARYTMSTGGKEIGRAYLDTHIVRTKKESVLVMLNLNGTVKRVEVVAFLEPPEYMPSDRWYKQFEGQTFDDDLKLQRDIHAVTGATLTAKATTDAVRRVMAIDKIVQNRRK